LSLAHENGGKKSIAFIILFQMGFRQCACISGIS